MGGGKLRFQPVAEGRQFIHFGDDAVLFGEWWERDQNCVQNFQVDVLLRRGRCERKQVGFRSPKKVLKILGVWKFGSGDEANDAIRETSVEAQDATISNVCRYGDA